MKLALGTAQFGLDYGVTNSKGKVTFEEASRILQVAREHGIRTLDTATAYGDSEKVLGMIGVDDFEVVTKIPPVPQNAACVSTWVKKSIETTFKALRVETLFAVLLHCPMQLIEKDGEEIYKVIQSFKAQGRIQKIGISVYGPEELDTLLPRYNFDLVQAPFNIMDRRLLTSGWLEKLNCLGIEVHTRSAFLQGLLLARPKERPAFFQPWSYHFARYDRWLSAEKISSLAACLGFAHQKTGIQRIVIGVQSAVQLEEIVATIPRTELTSPDALAVEDEKLINPAKWNL